MANAQPGVDEEFNKRVSDKQQNDAFDTKDDSNKYGELVKKLEEDLSKMPKNLEAVIEGVKGVQGGPITDLLLIVANLDRLLATDQNLEESLEKLNKISGDLITSIKEKILIIILKRNRITWRSHPSAFVEVDILTELEEFKDCDSTTLIFNEVVQIAKLFQRLDDAYWKCDSAEKSKLDDKTVDALVTLFNRPLPAGQDYKALTETKLDFGGYDVDSQLPCYFDNLLEKVLHFEKLFHLLIKNRKAAHNEIKTISTKIFEKLRGDFWSVSNDLREIMKNYMPKFNEAARMVLSVRKLNDSVSKIMESYNTGLTAFEVSDSGAIERYLDCKSYPNVLEYMDMSYFEAITKHVKPATLLLLDEILKTRDHVIPPVDIRWRFTQFFPLKETKVVIIGQDPYPCNDDEIKNRDYNDGLAFSFDNSRFELKSTDKFPKSLQRIFAALKTDIGEFPEPKNGSLVKWAEQGVLLIDDVLTLSRHSREEMRSHSDCGWEDVTDAILKEIWNECTGVVFMAWGDKARNKMKRVCPEYKQLEDTEKQQQQRQQQQQQLLQQQLLQQQQQQLLQQQLLQQQQQRLLQQQQQQLLQQQLLQQQQQQQRQKQQGSTQQSRELEELEEKNKYKSIIMEKSIGRGEPGDPKYTVGKMLILQSEHPVRSGYTGIDNFLDCKHFSKCNEFLKSQNKTEINWKL